MLTIPSLATTICHPIISLPKHFHFHFQKQNPNSKLCFQKQDHISNFCFQKTQMPPSTPSKIIAEYAKSNRSSCLKCSKTIDKKALRLGSVSRGSRGYDITKWHHVDCFSESVSSAEAIEGFDSLQSSDQEALKKLVSECKSSPDEESKVQKRKEDKEEIELEERSSKKTKVGFQKTQMPPSLPSKIIAEYAKSNRSSCKKCSKTIDKKALRLGSVSRDSRGFDMTKWHHFDCFSEPVSSAEAIEGFDLLQSSDQEGLKKLVSECKNSPDDKSKLSTTDEEVELDTPFSVSDIKDKYKDATLLPKWKAFQTIIFLERDDDLHDSRKIAAFDFDGCLVNTSVKRVGPDAWSLMYPSIPEKLQSLYNDGYKLVIFTNESNIERWKNKRQIAVDSKIGRLNQFIEHVKVPIQVFIACGLGGKAEDPFRKPKRGMWRIMEKHFNSGISIDMDQSFYVGDAAGRPDDHSDADSKFAQANGLKFYVPEEYFGA